MSLFTPNHSQTSPQFSSVTQSCLTLRTHGLQHTRFPLSITNLSTTSSRSLLRLMSIESVMPSNPLILCRSLLFLPSIFPSIRVFSSESVLSIRLLKYWPPMNIQDWFPLRLTGWILQSKGLSRVFSSTTVQKHQFFGAQLSYGPILTSIHNYWKNHSFD